MHIRGGRHERGQPPDRPGITRFIQCEPIDALVVVPLFLARGVHIKVDIPLRLGLPEGETWGTIAVNGKDIPHVYADPIGADPHLAELMIKSADTALLL